MECHHILVPVDFSEPSAKALFAAGILASRAGAKLTVINVREGLSREQALAELQSLVSIWLDGERESLTERVLDGSPVHATVQWARLHKVDLIVCGSYGKTGVAKILLGSFAERLIKLSTCPVLIHRRSQLVPGIKKMIVSLDLEDDQEETLAVARPIAVLMKSKVTLAHVLRQPHWRFFPRIDTDWEAVRAQVREALAELTEENESLRVVARTGNPANSLVDLADELQADLLVCGTRRRPRWETVLGSTAQKLVSIAPCSVLVVPLFGHDELPTTVVEGNS